MIFPTLRANFMKLGPMLLAMSLLIFAFVAFSVAGSNLPLTPRASLCRLSSLTMRVFIEVRLNGHGAEFDQHGIRGDLVR